MAEKTDAEKVQERQDGQYEVPVTKEPTVKTGIPEWGGGTR